MMDGENRRPSFLPSENRRPSFLPSHVFLGETHEQASAGPGRSSRSAAP
jgi:hypothetical protein